MNFDIIYINLEQATERRARFEAAIRDARYSGNLTRMIALTPDQVTTIDGKIKPSEKACYFSHLSAISHAQQSDCHTLILEDDTQFNAQTLATLDQLLSRIEDVDWDILYLDMLVAEPATMLRTYRSFCDARAENRYTLRRIDERIVYGSANSYVVNKKSKQKILSLLPRQNLVLCYDIAIRWLIWTKHLSGIYVIPFLTTISDLGDTSYIRDDHEHQPDRIWNCFRRMMCGTMPWEPSAFLKDFVARAEIPPRSRELSAVILAMFAKEFQVK